LLARCQHELLKIGVDDRVTRAMRELDPRAKWNADAIEDRQLWMSKVALDVWDVG